VARAAVEPNWDLHISPARSGKQGLMSRRGTSFGINFEGLVLVSLGRAPSRQGVRLYEKNAYSSLERSKNHPCHQNLVTMNGYQWSKYTVLAALVFASICCAVLTLEVLCKESNKKAIPGALSRCGRSCGTTNPSIRNSSTTSHFAINRCGLICSTTTQGLGVLIRALQNGCAARGLVSFQRVLIQA
jgi:hypothetical protein